MSQVAISTHHCLKLMDREGGERLGAGRRLVRLSRLESCGVYRHAVRGWHEWGNWAETRTGREVCIGEKFKGGEGEKLPARARHAMPEQGGRGEMPACEEGSPTYQPMRVPAPACTHGE